MLKTLLTQKSDKTHIQMFRYLFSAGCAFVLDFGSLFILTEYAKFYYLVSATIGFVLGVIVNYLISSYWVFPNRRFKERKIEAGLFTLFGIVGLILNIVLIWFFTEKLGIYYLISKVLSTGIVFFVSFGLKKLILFPSERP